MKYQFNQSAVEFAFNNKGEVSFEYDGVKYWSLGQAEFDNSPNNDFSTYSAQLVSSESDGDFMGKVEWNIINPDCEDESDACNWDEFSVYF